MKIYSYAYNLVGLFVKYGLLVATSGGAAYGTFVEGSLKLTEDEEFHVSQQ